MRKFLTFFLTALLAFGVGWADEYVLLTDVSQLEDGKMLIIASKKNNSGNVYAMYEQKTNNWSQTPSTISVTSANTIVAPGDAHIFTLEGSEGAWYFNTGDDTYLYAASSSNNLLKSAALSTAGDNAKAKIVINEAGASQITFQGTSSRNKLKYNSSNNLFSCYSTGQEDVYIYVKTEGSSTPYITVDPKLTINDATGDNKTGTLTPTLTNGQGGITAITNPSDKWSWNNNTVTFNGKELFADGTVTFSSTGAADVEADLEYNYTGPLYIIGYVNGGDWSANNMVKMEGPDDDGIYTVTLTTTPNGNNESEISFSKRMGSDWNAWGEIYEYRFVPVSNGPWGLTEGTLGGWHSLDFDPSHVDAQKIVMPAGTYTISIDAKNNKFKIERYIVPAETPTFSVPGGTYDENQTVTISCGTTGASIYYTTDGSDPTTSSTLYDGAITVDHSMTIKAIAVKEGYDNSSIASATYIINKTYRLVTDASKLANGDKIILVGLDDDDAYAMGESRGNNFGPVGVTIDNNTITTGAATVITLEADGDNWNLKTDGGYLYAASSSSNHLKLEDEPDANGNADAAISISNTEADIIFQGDHTRNKLRFNLNNGSPLFSCYASGMLPVYIYKEDDGSTPPVQTVATPVITPETGTYTEVQNVEITCATDGATISYKIGDGEYQTYTTAFEVSESCTITAKATKDGWEPSQEVSATYTINLPIEVNNLDEAKALNDDQEFNFKGEVVVTFKQAYTTSNGAAHTLIGLRDKDATEGGGVFHNAKAAIYSALDKGSVLNPGWTADKETYNGWIQFEDINNVTTAENPVEVLPFDRTGQTLTTANQSEYIILNNVTINGNTATVNTGAKAATSYTLYDRFNVEYEDGEYEYLTGVVAIYNNNINIYPLELKKKSKVATPTFDPGTGAYTTIQNVTISTETEEATISYKIGEDGEWMTYSEPIEVAESCTIFAKATKTGMIDSDVESATYTINLPTLEAPNFEPEAGTYDETQNVAISATNEATILYRIGEDGEWKAYSEPIEVAESCTIFAKASKKGYIDSEVNSAAYVIRKEAKLSFGETTAFTVYPGDDFTAPELSTTPEGLTPITYTITGNENEIVLFDESDGTVIINDSGKTGTVTIKASFAGNDTYKPAEASYTITVEPKPYMTAEPASLDFVTVFGNEPVSKTFTVMAENLKGDITLSMTESNVFTFTPATIAKADMTNEGVEVTVTYTPTAATGDDSDEATITLKTKDAEDVKVDLTGMATLPDPVLNVSTGTLEMGTKPSDTFTVTGQNLTEDVTVTVTGENAGKFTVNPATITPDENGKVSETVTVTYTGNSTTDDYATIIVKSGVAEKEVIVTARVLPTPEIDIESNELDLGTAGEGTFDIVADNLRGNITLESNNPNFTVNPTSIAPDENGEVSETVTVTYNGNNTQGETATITITTEGGEPVTITVTAKAETYVDTAKPTFSPAAGTYTEPKWVAIACATPGATIEYTMDGVTKTYGGPFLVDHNCTVTAKASKGAKIAYNDSEMASATYTINKAPAATIADDYYFLQNNADEVAGKYANVAGRRTLNFVAAEAAKAEAGTVFRIETGEGGKVQTLRSQAVDLQGYANRAMAYVPKVIEVVLNRLAESSLGDPETPGTGILGENGLDLILKKFYENFDYNLYIEQANGGYRIFGRTPSMQHVVDFYHENTAQVEEKLPMLESYINQVLDKIRNKIPAPYDPNVVVPFSLKKVRDRIADKYGISLIDPTEDLMGFYRQVLNNKEYVWDFAYQTAMMYVDVIKQTGTYQSLDPEYKLFVEKMEKVRPDTKYYIIERGNELDYISENNGEIISNDPRTLWKLEPRETFKLNSAGELFGCPLATNGVGGYFTTNYTDFAYTLPTGVTAYKVTAVDEDGEATLEALTGIIPAQTPVLLVAKEDGAYEVTLTTEAGTADMSGNLLEGPDYLITRYQFKTPMVVDLFTYAQGLLGENMYNTYVAPYEYLQLRYAGTVNNKYFWNVNSDLGDINGINVLRSLSTNTGELAFSDDSKTETNKAFMVSETLDAITLPGTLRYDVNHDGLVNIKDVTDLIDRLLVVPDAEHLKACPYCSDIDENGVVHINDVTKLIDILLGVDHSSQTTNPEEGEGGN